MHERKQLPDHSGIDKNQHSKEPSNIINICCHMAVQNNSQINTRMIQKGFRTVPNMCPKCTPGTHFAHKVSRSPFSLDFRMPLGCHWIPIGLPLGGFGETLGTTWPHILMKNLSKSISWNRLHFSYTFSSFFDQI